MFRRVVYSSNTDAFIEQQPFIQGEAIGDAPIQHLKPLRGDQHLQQNGANKLGRIAARLQPSLK